MNRTFNYKQAVNLFNGQINTPLQIVYRKGRNGLDLKLDILYTSNVWNGARTWNLDSPTGTLGLGWDLPFESIVIYSNKTGNRANDKYYYHGNGEFTEVICTGVTVSGSLQFACIDYRFWNIQYIPATETWIIIKESGDTYIFGDSNSNRNTVAWFVTWNNWMGSSNQTTSQVKRASAWHLSKVNNRFQDTLTYFYNTVSVNVGAASGLAFTQAVYIDKITGINNESMQFFYKDKDPKEYQNPHTNPPPPNAWQDTVSAKYLDRVTEVAGNGQTLVTHCFTYNVIGTDTLVKRLLVSIKSVYPNGKSQPDMKFAYYGQNGDDGVNPDIVFNASKGALYGAMKQVALPLGGIVSVAYTSCNPVFSNRKLTAAAPVVSGVTFSKPRFYFEDNFTVTTWLGSNNTIAVQAYTWDGRWIVKEFSGIPIAGSEVYDTLAVASSQNLFAVYTGERLYTFFTSSAQAGEWLQPAVVSGSATVPYFTPGYVGETIGLAVGNRFVGILGNKSGKLNYYTWNGASWEASPQVTLSAGVAPVFSITAKDNYMMAAAHPQDQKLCFYLYFLDVSGSWQNQSFVKDSNLAQADTFQLYSGASFVMFRTSSTLAGNVRVENGVAWWSDDFLELSAETWDVQSFAKPADAPVPRICGSLITLNQLTYRFNGVSWIFKDLSTLNYPNQISVEAVSVSEDKVLRRIKTSNAAPYTYDMVQFNPDTATWSVPQNMHLDCESSTLAIAAPYNKEGSGNYVILAGQLWYQAADGNWTPVFTLPDTLTTTDLPSVQLIRSSYIAYQVNTDTANVKTRIFILRNGAVANRSNPIDLNGEQIYAAGVSPYSLAALYGFSTFTGAYGASDSVMNLHRVVNDAVSDVQTQYAVSNISVNSGNETIITGYMCDNAYATVDALGYELQLNKSASMPGAATLATAANGYSENYFFSGLTNAESSGLAYPVDPNNANTSSYYSRIKGRQYNVKVYIIGDDGKAGVVSETTNFGWVTQKQLGRASAGFYVRIHRYDTTLDNVLSSVLQQYSPDTGLITQTSKTNYNSDSDALQLIEVMKYWWEIYDTNRSLNLLTPVIQVTEKSNNATKGTETVSGIFITTWKKDWGIGLDAWAPDRYYRAKNGSPAAFNSWNASDPPPPADWLLCGQVQKVEQNGSVAISTDTLSRYTSSIYDKTHLLKVCEANNTDSQADELSYLGFEPYEKLNGWSYSQSGISIWDQVTKLDFYTGTQSLQMLPNPAQKYGPYLLLQPDNQSRKFIFGCWAQTETGFSPASGKAAFEISFYKALDGAKVTAATLLLDLSGAVNQWTYFQQLIDLDVARAVGSLPANTILYFTIQGYNQNQTKKCYLDNLRYSPVDSVFGATVYDPVDYRITSIIDNNGQAVSNVFNGFYNNIASYGPQGRVNYINSITYSRDISNADVFQPKFPNSILNLTTTSQSRYYDFHDGKRIDWQFSDDNLWSVSGQLTFTGSKTEGLGSTATLKVVAYTNFAARVNVSRVQQTNMASVALGNGVYYVRWNQTNTPKPQWELIQLQADASIIVKAADDKTDFCEEWIYAIVDGFILFYANGTQLFSYKYDYPKPMPSDYGRLQLALTQSGSFDDLLLLHEPQMNVDFYDGLGVPTQQIELEGKNISGVFNGQYSVLGKGVFLDNLGRPQYVRESLTAKVTLAPISGTNAALPTNPQLLDGDIDTYLYNDDGTHQTITEFLNAEKLLYTTQVFENTPISRIKSRIMPRDKNTDASKYTYNYSYSASTSPDIPTPPPAGTTGKYFVEKKAWTQSVDKNGTVTNVEYIIIRDLTGAVLKERYGKTGGPYVETGYRYNGAGMLTDIRQPNYYTLPGHSTTDTWQQKNTYTFNGLVSKQHTTDSDDTQFIYDDGNRLRFVLDADGAALNPQRIIYFKYDYCDRMVESGIIQDSRYSWGADGAALQAKANTQQFPITDPSQSGNPEYAAGIWKKRLYYNYNAATPQGFNLIGRLWKVEINNGATPDNEIYTYDAFGNRIRVDSLVNGYDNNTRAFNYAYNNQDKIQSIEYPVQVGHNNFAVGYYYNRLGRLASVGQNVDDHGVIDPYNPPRPPEKAYAEYSYDPNGRLNGASLNNGVDPGINNAVKRSMQYNTNGLLTKIQDAIPAASASSSDTPFFIQDLYYYEDSIPDATRYYDGNVAVYKATYLSVDELWTKAPESFTIAFQYDTQSCLTEGRNSLQNAWSFFTGNTPYDANGNMLAMKRGITDKTYRYRQSDGKQINNQINDIQSAVNIAMNFEGVPPDAKKTGDWSWGSNNGGPSATGIYNGDKHSGTQCLKVTGGSLTHFDSLVLSSYLDTGGTYILNCWIKTGPGFAAASGDAAWFACIYGAQTKISETKLKTAAESAAWTEQSISIDMKALLALGLNEPVSYITIELRNYKRSPDGSTGPYLLIDDISLSGSFASDAYGYNLNGNVISAPADNIFHIDYDPVIQCPASLQLNSDKGEKLTYAFGVNDQHILELHQDRSGASVYSKQLFLNGLSQMPLVEKTTINGNESTQLYIYGLNGILAFDDGSTFQYPLSDHIGSPGILVSENRTIQNVMDYMPFGQRFRQTQATKLDYLFRGNEYNGLSHLYNYNNRLYAPDLQRCFSVNKSLSKASPYVFGGDNPVNIFEAGDKPVTHPLFYFKYRDCSREDVKKIYTLRETSTSHFNEMSDFIELDGKISVRIRNHARICRELHKDIYMLVRSQDYSEKVTAINVCTQEFTELPEDSYIFVWRVKDNAIFAHSGCDRIWQDRVDAYCKNLKNPETSIKHTQIAEGDKVYAAGKFEYRDGRMIWVSNSSGHYTPPDERLAPFSNKLKVLNVNTTGIEFRKMGAEGRNKGRIWNEEETDNYCPGNSCFIDWVVKNRNTDCMFTERVFANLEFRPRNRWP